MTSTAIAPGTAQIIRQLEPDRSMDAALQRVLENEIRRRLAAYELTDRTFQRKYGMTLPEFEAARIVEQHGYSFEAESDHQEWDQAIDGMATLRGTLQELQQQQ